MIAIMLFLCMFIALPAPTGGSWLADGVQHAVALPAHMVFLPLVTGAHTRFTDGADTLSLDNGRLRVVVDKRWGGAIREIWFEGKNLVNNFDGGRLSGVSLYDKHTVPPSGDIADPAWGWNPTPSDIYDHANPPLAYSFDAGVLYVKARNLHWNPNSQGGGPAQAAPSDILVETWIDLPPLAVNGIHVRYRVTHDGADVHGRVEQELGYVYVRPAYRRFVRYTGPAPWMHAPVQIRETPPIWPAFGKSAATEHWGGFVDANDFGLIFWTPQAYPRFGYVFHNLPPPTDNSTAYLNPMTLMGHAPGAVYEMEQYLFAGRWQDARSQIYTLRQQLGEITDVLPGFGTIDLPTPNAIVSGAVDVAGWALDDRSIARVEVLLDGQVVGQAHYGTRREDVGNHYPGFPGLPDVGFSLLLDSTAYDDGSHILQVRAVDASGNTALLCPESLPIQIANRSIPGGFKLQWPEFARLNWNRPPVTDYQTWDKLTRHVSGPAVTTVEVMLQGIGDKRQELSLGEGVEHLAAAYFHLRFNDPDVRTVAFYNGYTFDLTEQQVQIEDVGPVGATLVATPLPEATRQNAHVWALIKTRGHDWQAADWADEGIVRFCRDAPDEAIEELVLIFSNSQYQDRTAGGRQKPAHLAPTLWASNLGCWQWAGQVTGRQPMDGDAVLTIAAQITFQRTGSAALPLVGGGAGEWFTHDWHEAQGTLTWGFSGVDEAGCTWWGSDTVTLGPGDAPLLVANYLVSGAVHRMYMADPSLDVFFRRTCPWGPDGPHLITTWWFPAYPFRDHHEDEFLPFLVPPNGEMEDANDRNTGFGILHAEWKLHPLAAP